MNIEINGVTLQADFMDADFMDKLEPALAETQRKIANGKMQQYSSISAAYRALNEVMENFFDQVFGAGTSDRLFNGSQNVMEHMKAVAVMNSATAQRKSSTISRTAILKGQGPVGSIPCRATISPRNTRIDSDQHSD